MLSPSTGLNCAQSGTRLGPRQCQKSCDSTPIGRSTYTFCLSFAYANKRPSSKLREENAKIKAARESGLDAIELPSRAVSPDDEGSIVKELTRGNTSCGCCRTRESTVWWRAPKGLPTNVLCDNCGLSWRKYADLNVRPYREDAMAKNKLENKREGTPLSGPANKRAKVSACVLLNPVDGY